jgi:RNA polymerase sigma factor for flagellar operon FliA
MVRVAPRRRRAIEHLALWKRLRAHPRDVAVRNQLAELHVPLVHQVAGRLRKRLLYSIDHDTLASAGFLGLLQAIATYDVARGLKFTSFAQNRIRGAMLDELRGLDYAPRLQRRCEATRNRAERELTQEFGRPPTEDEVYLATRIHRRELPAVLTSIDRVLFESAEGKQVRPDHLLADRRQADPRQRLAARERLQQILRGCSQRERLMLLMYYVEDATMKEIAAQLGISESRVSQQHSMLLARLRSRLETVGCRL